MTRPDNVPHQEEHVPRPPAAGRAPAPRRPAEADAPAGPPDNGPAGAAPPEDGPAPSSAHGPEPDPRVTRTRARARTAVIALLTERGAGGVTMEAVAARAGIAKSSLYRHWSGLPALVLDAFQSISPGPPDEPATGDVRADLEQFLCALAATLTEAPWAPLLATLTDAAERDTELRGLLDALIDRHRAPLRRLVAAAVEAGLLPAHTDPDLLTGLLGGSLYYRRIVSHEPVDADHVRRLLDLWLGPAS